MKLIATDLDGTLLQSDGSITDKDLNAILEAEKVGIKVIVATGRQYSTTKLLLKNYNFKPDYMICDNGCTVYSVKDDKQLYAFPLPKECLSDILKYLEDNDYFYGLSSDECRIELSNYKELLTAEYNRNKKSIPDLDISHLTSLIELIDNETTHISEGINNHEDIEKLDMNFYNITAISFDPKRLEKGMKEIDHFPGITVVSSAYNNFELMNKNASKGNALKFLADYLHVSLDDTMAIGDNFNDLSMLQTAKHSVAMGNSCDEIKSLCRYVTKSNVDSGVGHAIMSFALNKR